MDRNRTTKLANGVEMPKLGLGVWKVDSGAEVVNSVQWAIEAGYRAIDTAAVYKNEAGVGKGIAQSGIKREELFVTTKVWNSDQGYDQTLAAYEESLSKLNLDYVDLYLIHWPVEGKYKETWRALETLYEAGKVRAIGVSNFKEHHLEDLLADAKIAPMINQVELHPLLNQEPLRKFCAQHGIAVEAWSPLGQGKLLVRPELKAIGDKYGKTPAQVILRWDLQNNIFTIPKSVHKERIEQNAAIFDFELSAEDIATINDLNTNERFGPDPDHFDF
ncbi:aldo/keto reductase [Vagococcus entomophilus]|uniref:Aldo/keto reductase n=1 Tax=Vagococcus entomophilus TaxID=1160095 RepID=A0A430AH92_9ENTE|nr:aldo/keto reductase [Vagococcus entomophilus]RSU07147.1 aldo/keto reductase [Vagococcus entomophilus]